MNKHGLSGSLTDTDNLQYKKIRLLESRVFIGQRERVNLNAVTTKENSLEEKTDVGDDMKNLEIWENKPQIKEFQKNISLKQQKLGKTWTLSEKVSKNIFRAFMMFVGSNEFEINMCMIIISKQQ